MASAMSSTGGDASDQKCEVLALEALNPHVRRIEFAVRGPLARRAEEIERELQQGVPKSFSEVIRADIGDCQATGQKPLTFLRQVLALCTYPELLSNDSFPEDAKDRARRILDGCDGNSIGSYCWLAGMPVVRRDVATYITARDGGIPCDWTNVFLSQGATDSIKYMMKLMMKPGSVRKAGVMVPVPQHPLYSAIFSEYDACQIPYHLNEDNSWALEMDELERALNEARSHCDPRILVIINPGNPTGQVLDDETMERVIKFAHKEKLFILADEVYQLNIHTCDANFHSFKKVLGKMPPEFHDLELASFMSASKGYLAECGFRGGWVEVLGLLQEAMDNMIKFLSAKLCPNILGQCALEVLVNPPQPGEPSYESHQTEQQAVLGDLSRNTRMTLEALRKMEGVTCCDVMGAIYVFPRLHLPPMAIETAREAGQEPDVFYCSQLLEEGGICVLPGSGFSQKGGTHHFRMTILPQAEQLREMLGGLAKFHAKFMRTYK